MSCTNCHNIDQLRKNVCDDTASCNELSESNSTCGTLADSSGSLFKWISDSEKQSVDVEEDVCKWIKKASSQGRPIICVFSYHCAHETPILHGWKSSQASPWWSIWVAKGVLHQLSSII